MIKYFRKVRQSMLSEGKSGKYLKYAIGEIILVVIGILLALQINSWNQHRIENKQEKEVLSSLKEEFQYNFDELEESILINKKVTQSCVKLTELIRTDSINKMPEVVDKLLVNVGGFNSFDARIGISGEVVNSGKLQILKNDEIRAQLGNWLKILSDCEEDIHFRSDNYTMNLMPFLMKRFPLANGELSKKFEFDKSNYLVTYKDKSPFRMNLNMNELMEFENQIWHHKHNHDYVVINELIIKDFINSTIKMIEEELNNIE
jgi:hypothetical protein